MFLSDATTLAWNNEFNGEPPLNDDCTILSSGEGDRAVTVDAEKSSAVVKLEHVDALLLLTLGLRDIVVVVKDLEASQS